MSGERTWGWWTRGKLDMLADYLPGFTTAASKKAPTANYLDLFAGHLNNTDRETGEPIPSSFEIALGATPQFTHVALFELKNAAELETGIRARFPGRTITVTDGDCNETLEGVLSSGDLSPKAPTFAFIDPDGPHCWWTTLERLANHKRNVSRFKIELWMLFPHSQMTRFLVRTGALRTEFADQVTRVFGTAVWRRIYDARVAGVLRPAEARFEYVNLMRWRLEHELDYRWTHAFTIRMSRGPLYDMIFATDNDTGDKIMNATYRKAAGAFPVMAEEARRRRQAQGSLFPATPEAPEYRHEPPLPPYGSNGR